LHYKDAPFYYLPALKFYLWNGLTFSVNVCVILMHFVQCFLLLKALPSSVLKMEVKFPYSTLVVIFVSDMVSLRSQGFHLRYHLIVLETV